MTTEKKSPANEEKNTTAKPIELNENDLEQMKGGTGVHGVVEADPCAGGRARTE